MSGQVASHTRGLQFFHGIIVTPSGRLLSVRARPAGSSLEGTCAVMRALCTIVIDGPMTIVAPFTVFAAESMGSQVVHLSSTVLAIVVTTKSRP